MTPEHFSGYLGRDEGAFFFFRTHLFFRDGSTGKLTNPQRLDVFLAAF